MNKEKLDFYKNKLNKEKETIELEIKRNEETPNFGNDVDDFEEKTDEAEAINNQAGVVGDLKNRLDDINVALQKIELGGYGMCEKCDRPIEEEILDVDPESRLCKEHKLSV